MITTQLIGAAITGSIAAGMYYVIVKRWEFEVTWIAKIAIAFYVIKSVAMIFFDFYQYFSYSWPEEMPDYRIGPIVDNTIVAMVFVFPLMLGKQYLTFSFIYVLVSYVLILVVVVSPLTGDVYARHWVAAGIKFGIVLYVLLGALKRVPEPTASGSR